VPGSAPTCRRCTTAASMRHASPNALIAKNQLAWPCASRPGPGPAISPPVAGAEQARGDRERRLPGDQQLGHGEHRDQHHDRTGQHDQQLGAEGGADHDRGHVQPEAGAAAPGRDLQRVRAHDDHDGQRRDAQQRGRHRAAEHQRRGYRSVGGDDQLDEVPDADRQGSEAVCPPEAPGRVVRREQAHDPPRAGARSAARSASRSCRRSPRPTSSVGRASAAYRRRGAVPPRRVRRPRRARAVPGRRAAGSVPRPGRGRSPTPARPVHRPAG